MQISLVLGFLLIATVSGSYFYINMQKAQLAQLQNQLRNTFARHDLNNLAIAKPGLIEKIVNRGTAKVHQQFVDLTNPRQFDETSNPE